MITEDIIKVKIRALELARDMKPSPTYSGIGQQPITPYYNILKEAESIYEWIIKL